MQTRDTIVKYTNGEPFGVSDGLSFLKETGKERATWTDQTTRF
jgi:hypothetical protein